MNKKHWITFGCLLFSAQMAFFALGYFLGFREGRKPNIKRGVWVLIQETPYSFHVAGITNANTVFVTNLNIQGSTK